MSSQLTRCSAQYAATLRAYLQREQEAVLQRAYELGRKAIRDGLGVLDMARIHQQALASCLRQGARAARGRPGLRPGQAQILNAAETFLLEALSPFEAAHRGFREANVKLWQLNDLLEGRNRDLGRINRQLEKEISERRRAQRALEESEEGLRSLSKQVLRAQEQERKRISRELHDQVGQALTAISTHFTMLGRNGVVDSHALQRRLADAQNLLKETMQTVHGFARELRPDMLDELGLVPALRSYLKAFAERTGLRVRFSPRVLAQELDEEQKIVVYRVAQEGLTNVARHAQATRVAVTLREVPQGVRILVQDNGRGFDVAQHLGVNGKKRLGLLGMQERLRLVNGRFGVRSRPGQGTTVAVEIPFRAGRALAVPHHD